MQYFSIVIISTFISLLSHGSQGVNEADIYGTLPLQEAASKGDEAACQKLIALGAIVDGRDYREKTALHVAAYWGHLSVCEILIEHGVSINALDVDGDTALHLAAAGGYTDICKLLRAHGADISIRSRFRGTPLDAARRANEDGSHTEVIECLLRDAKYGEAPSSFAATRRPDDCGYHNGAQCSAKQNGVLWSIGNSAWKNFKDSHAKCHEEGGAWKCNWSDAAPGSLYLASAPCLDFQKGQSWTMQLEIIIDLSAPEAPQGLEDYPAFAIEAGLIEKNSQGPLVSERFDFSKIRHENWRWQLHKNVQLSVSTREFEKDLECAHVAVWAANRLKNSGLSGTIAIKNAAIMILLDTPQPNVFNLQTIGLVLEREDLISCPEPSQPFCRGMSCDANIGYVTGCTLKEGFIDGSLAWYQTPVVFHVDYVHTCTGTPLSIGILVGEDQRAEFVSDGSQNALEVTGRGPIAFRDFEGADYTAKAILSRPCSIRISRFYVRPVNELGEDEIENF